MNDDLATLKTRFEPKEAKVLKLDRQMNAARFTACGRFLLAAGHDGLVRRFDATADDLPELKPLAGHGGWVQRVIPAKDEEVVFSADSWGQLRCASFADETATPRWANAAAHDGWILDLALSPNGKLLATCGIDRAVRVWSAADGSKLHEFSVPEWEVFSVVFAPDDVSVLAGDLSGKVRQWELASGKITREFDASSLHKADRLQEVGGVRRMLFVEAPRGEGQGASDRSKDGAPSAGSSSPSPTPQPSSLVPSYKLLCAGTKPKNGGNVQGVPAVLVFDWTSGQLEKTIELGKDGDVYVTDLAFHPAGFLMGTISGNPGAGKLVFRRLEDDAAFFETTKMPNCHSVTLHPSLPKFAVIATNGGSNGNGRNLDKEGKYPGNFSPIHVWTLPDTGA
jgi:WD40 repeat protein